MNPCCWASRKNYIEENNINRLVLDCLKKK